jgi:hypothetical protein
MFFMENPEASRRLANALNEAMRLSLLTPERQIEAVEASRRAKSWNGLPKWLRDVVDQVEAT